MRTPLMLTGLFVLAGTAGCAGSGLGGRIEEASDLVESRSGHRPDWQADWDADWQAWDHGPVLELEPALVLALRNNRALRAELERIGQADADLMQAGLMQNPVLNFMIMFPAGGGRSMLRSSGFPMQPLQDLWLIPARRKVAAAELQQAVLRVADRAVETAAAVKRLYARLQYVQRAIELVDENAELVGQSTELLEVRLAAAQATQSQLTLSQIRGLRLRSDRLALAAEYRSLQRELLMLLGRAGAPDDWRVTPLAEESSVPAAPPAEEDLWRLATEQRLDVQAARWEAQAALERVGLSRKEGWPELRVGVTFERAPAPRSNPLGWRGQAGNSIAQGAADALAGRMAETPGATVSPFGEEVDAVTWTVGPMLELELPVFDRNQAKAARAVHEYRERLAAYEDRVQDVTRQVRQNLVAHRQAYEQIRFFQAEVIPAVQRNLDLARQSFMAGREDLTIYLQVQEDLLTTRMRVLEFFRDYLVSRADLERQVGGRLDLIAALESAPPASAPAAPAPQ